MIQLILSKKLEKILFVLKKKAKFYLNINYLAHFFLILSLIFLLVFFINQDKNWIILSGLGGKCLDFENKDFINGAYAIGYECFDNKDTQHFNLSKKRIKFEDKCLAVMGDEKEGSKLAFRTCNNSQSQQWQYNTAQNAMVSSSGQCVDLGGGAQFWHHHQLLILWTCNGSDNQKWYLSKPVPAKNVKNKNVILANQLEKVIVSEKVIAERSGKLNFKNGYKDGLLLTEEQSSLIKTSKEFYLVPAGKVERDVFK